MEAVRSREFRGNCAHFATIYQTLALAAGLDARFVGIEADQWNDGVGHALIEVWLPESRSWMIVDPLFHAHFLDAAGRPLSVLALRDLVLAGRTGEVRVVQGEIRTGRSTPEEVLETYVIHIDRVMYPGGNNLLEARGAIYDSWPARALRLEAWPRPLRRAMENSFWNLDRRYIYVDRPEYDDAMAAFYVYRASWGLLLCGLVWLLSRRVLGRRPEQGRIARAVTDSA
jgi:hypothetical protein